MSGIAIGVVSDTHMPRFGKALPAALRDGLAGVDVIVHCGDIVEAQALEWFAQLAPVEAVAGNNDPPALVRRLGRKKILQFGAIRIGVTHGHDGIGRSTLARAQQSFAHDAVDAVLFGHSHVPYCRVHDGVLCFNPGSPTDKRRQPEYSFGIIRISEGRLAPELRFYTDKSP